MDDLKKRADNLISKIDIGKKKKQIRELKAQSLHANFWQDHKNAGKKMKELARLQKEIEEVEYLELLLSEGNKKEAEDLLNNLETLLYLSGIYDSGNAILSIHAGQGGVEAIDWAQMLLRMYTRFFEKKGWKFDVIEEIPGEEAGIKSVTIEVAGDFAYCLLIP